jgi:hypothetical protein
MIFLSVFLPLQGSIGFWPALAVLVPAGLAAGLLVDLLLRPLKRKRIALDAKGGIELAASPSSLNLLTERALNGD